MRPEPDDIEEMRETYIGGLDEDQPTWHEDYKPGTFGCHEAMDRTALIMQLVDDLSSHPGILQREDWYRMASQAFGLLWSLYQSIGNAEHDALPHASVQDQQEGKSA